MNPLQPFDLAPKDGDFARYVEQLVAESGRRLREAEPRSWSSVDRVPGATRIDAVPDVAPDTDILTQSGSAIDPITERFGRSNARLPNVPDVPGVPGGAASPASRTGTATASRQAAGDRTRVPGAAGAPSTARTRAGAQTSGPPDLGDLVVQVSGGLAKLIGAIGALWLILGAFLDIPFFADTVFIAMMMIFIAVFLHNQRRRKPKQGSGGK